MKPVPIVIAAVALGACAAAPTGRPDPGRLAMMPAMRVAEPKLAEPDVAVLLAAPVLAPAGMGSPVRRKTPIAGPPRARVEAANRAALREPAGEDYRNAVQVYAFSPGALYRLYAAPGQVSDIALEPGEGLVSVAAGDTARWIIGDTVSGSGAGQRTHILVKPASAGLDTNLVIATDRRVYHVQLASNASTAMAGISWTYPEASLIAVRGQGAEVTGAVPTAAASTYTYAIEGDRPVWRPIRAFDDGRQVFIEFPAGLARGEAPPLFVANGTGRPALVNYRVKGRFYMVDQLFAAAELRLGEGRQQVVRIVRQSAAPKRRRGRP